jgi:hypothetical protein
MSTEPETHAVLLFPSRPRALALIGRGRDGHPSQSQSQLQSQSKLQSSWPTADNWPPADPGVPDWPPPELDDCGESIITQPSASL